MQNREMQNRGCQLIHEMQMQPLEQLKRRPDDQLETKGVLDGKSVPLIRCSQSNRRFLSNRLTRGLLP